MPVRVSNKTRATVVAERVTTASSFLHRLRGLIGQRELPRGQALHLDPCNSIHTFFMRFPIDAVFLDSDKRVVGLRCPLGPWHVAGAHRSARSVLELPAGSVAASGTNIGDLLTFERV